MQSTSTLSLVFYLMFIAITLIALAAAFHQVIKGKLPKEKLDTLVELFKYGVVTMAVTTVGTIISDQFKERDQDVKELEYFHRYVDHATKLDGQDRYKLTRFLATVAPEGPMRDAWKSYYDSVLVEYNIVLAHNAQLRADSLGDSNTLDLKKAAAEEANMNVVVGFSQTLISTTKALVYIQYCGDNQLDRAVKMRQLLNALGWSAPDIEKKEKGCDSSIRYFHDDDKALADLINLQLGNSFTTKKVNLKAPNAQIEVWIGE